MPLYEYYCKKCDANFDVYHPAGQNGQKCPKCKSKVEKVFHAPGLIFKGSGWHVTDYCNGKNNNASTATKAAPCEKKADGACANPTCAD